MAFIAPAFTAKTMLADWGETKMHGIKIIELYLQESDYGISLRKP